MLSVPFQSLDFPGHAAEQGGVVLDDVAVDAVGQRFVVGVAGEVAIFDHPQPDIGLLGSSDKIFNEGILERWARPTAFMALSLKVELEGFPHDFEGELETLDGGVADEVVFRLDDGFSEAGCAFTHFGLPFNESFFAHCL